MNSYFDNYGNPEENHPQDDESSEDINIPNSETTEIFRSDSGDQADEEDNTVEETAPINDQIDNTDEVDTNNVNAGLSSLGVPGVPWHPQILADQLTLS